MNEGTGCPRRATSIVVLRWGAPRDRGAGAPLAFRVLARKRSWSLGSPRRGSACARGRARTRRRPPPGRRPDMDDRLAVAGAIRTAVCCRDVVAPPISSGRSSSRRCISFATWTISSSEGVMSPEQPTMWHPSSLGGVQQDVGRDHHPEVDDLVVVAAEDHADDVLADVVDVALDRAERPPCPAAERSARRDEGCFSSSMKGCEVGDRLLHRAGALDDLRQEHLARAEEVADDLHPGHERALDDVERTVVLEPCLFAVLHDPPIDAVDQAWEAAVRPRRRARRGPPRSRAPIPAPSRRTTSRSVASGRRLKITSSTWSSRSFGMSS